MNKHLKIAIAFLSFIQTGITFSHIACLSAKNTGKAPAQTTAESNLDKPSAFLIKPGFEILTGPYVSTDNSLVSINDFFKQPNCKFIALEFWASWCPPCRALMPTLAKEALEWKEGGVWLIGINIEENVVKAKEVQVANNIQAPWLIDSEGRLQKFFKISSIPYMIVVDKEGEIILEGHPSRVQDDVKKLLEAPTKL